ncbi:MAG TPA: hypothetical protein VFR86_23675 [Burkholderiaceae bacterium]|nr:hypothetical protein [Burkholderiaceae bacterium]
MNEHGEHASAPGENWWRHGFFIMSAAMAASALVDLDAGRIAHATGDAGVACLMLSLLPQYPFVRAIIGGRSRPREELAREVEHFRERHRWVDRLGSTGWLLFLGSLILRAFGMS